jgi:hypothetical protein
LDWRFEECGGAGAATKQPQVDPRVYIDRIHTTDIDAPLLDASGTELVERLPVVLVPAYVDIAIRVQCDSISAGACVEGPLLSAGAIELDCALL